MHEKARTEYHVSLTLTRATDKKPKWYPWEYSNCMLIIHLTPWCRCCKRSRIKLLWIAHLPVYTFCRALCQSEFGGCHGSTLRSLTWQCIWRSGSKPGCRGCFWNFWRWAGAFHLWWAAVLLPKSRPTGSLVASYTVCSSRPASKCLMSVQLLC